MTGVGPTLLFLLGGIEVRAPDPGGGDRLLAQSKAMALLAYLALSPAGRFQRRDRLVGLLWPELDQTHGRGALRKAVHSVRSSLGESVLEARGDEELMLARGQLWCDAVECYEMAEARRFGEALNLYRGELMPGFHLAGCSEFGMWLEEQRASFVRLVSGAAWAVARDLEDGSQLTEAGAMASRAARYAWSDERALRRAMLMLQRVGDTAGALYLFADFARRLRAELDAAPSAETEALADKMRKGTA
jgi:serine/threonine-protein kinase